MAKEELNLTPEQQQRVTEFINKAQEDGTEISLLKMTKFVFQDEKLNGQSKQGRALKEHLASLDVDYGTRTNKLKGDIELSEDQKKQLDSNLSHYIKQTLGLVEIANIVFNRTDLTNLHQETRSVLKYYDQRIESLNVDDYKKIVGTATTISDIARSDYKPPRRLVEVLSRINKYVPGTDWKEDTIKHDQRKMAESLMRYLNVFRIKYEINSFAREAERELFEDAFVRYTYNKPNLESEEIDQYCTLAAERVNEINLRSQIDTMNRVLDQQSQDSEGKKLSKVLTDAITSARSDLNACASRQNKLYDNLVTKRSKKQDIINSENASLVQWVVQWKQEEFREKTLHLADAEQQKLADEVDRLSSMDELLALVKGIDPRELYGNR